MQAGCQKMHNISTTSILEVSKLQRLVKSYYHTKFQTSSSKIDRFMAILVHDPPRTPLNPTPLMLLTSLYLNPWSRTTTMQNFGLLAQKLTKLLG